MARWSGYGARRCMAGGSGWCSRRSPHERSDMRDNPDERSDIRGCRPAYRYRTRIRATRWLMRATPLALFGLGQCIKIFADWTGPQIRIEKNQVAGLRG